MVNPSETLGLLCVIIPQSPLQNIPNIPTMLRTIQQPSFQKAMDSNHEKRLSAKVNQSMKN